MKKMQKIQTSKKKIFSSFKKNLFLGSVVIITLIANIILSMQTVSSGSKLASLEKSQSELNKKNKEITLLLVNATSLTSVENEASGLGYLNSVNVAYIKESEVVASRLP